MSEQAKCELCGEPMPPGEEMFKIHGFSGNCPKPPLPQPSKELLSRMGDAEDECRSVSVGGAMVDADEFTAQAQADAKTIADLRAQVNDLTEELKSANTLLGDAGFYIRRMAKIIEGYSHPSGIHRRAMEWLRTKWKAINLFTRWDREGRDVTNLPGLWDDSDVQVSATNFSHPTITSGQHTNGPATIWLKRCVDGAEWINTGMHQMHKVRDAWCLANSEGRCDPLYQFGEIR
jgi:hypothetical protein